jgi:hypothetical protein
VLSAATLIELLLPVEMRAAGHAVATLMDMLSSR